MSIDVANESGVEVDEAALLTLARYVLDRMQVHPLAELSLLLVDTDAMSELHQQWMDEEGPTDVLAFPMDELRPGHEGSTPSGRDDDEEPGLLGDVVLCPHVAANQATAAGHRMEEELHLLCTHGVLHLLGYDHEDPEEKREMFGLQSELLSAWREDHRDAARRAP